MRGMIDGWRRWHQGALWKRWPVKLLLLAALIVLTLYPKVWLIPEWLRRESNLDALLDPNHPWLAQLEAEVREKLPPDAQPRQALDTVQTVVYRHVPYAWDWDVWGVVDYIPTVQEVYEKGREDCDGRAVVAASLLRRMGYEAHVVSDILHMWVETPQGDTMSPTGGAKTLVGGPGGTTPHITWGLFDNLLRGNAYGIAVFPLLRELILIGGLAMLTLHPRSRGWRSFSGLLMMLLALAIVRIVGQEAAHRDLSSSIEFLAAIGIFLAGLVLVGLRGAARPPDSAPAPHE